MIGVIEGLFGHAITIEPYLGDTAYGPKYGAPVPDVPCFLDGATRAVRGPDGTRVMSSSTAYAALDTVAPALSRVTLPDGRQTTVIVALRRDGGGLPVPDHLEIQLV